MATVLVMPVNPRPATDARSSRQQKPISQGRLFFAPPFFIANSLGRATEVDVDNEYEEE